MYNYSKSKIIFPKSFVYDYSNFVSDIKIYNIYYGLTDRNIHVKVVFTIVISHIYI